MERVMRPFVVPVLLAFLASSFVVASPSVPEVGAATGILDAACTEGPTQGELLAAAAKPLEPIPLDELPLPTDEATHPCTGFIQPGALMTSPVGCTYNFVFTDTASALYVGTAGHCTSSVGQRVAANGVGTFGTVVYRVNGGPGNDFTLIQIDTDKYAKVETTLCHWNGPTGGMWEGGAVERTILNYGWGYLWVHGALRAKVKEFAFTSGTYHSFAGPVAGGDSGSPDITQSGKALGLTTHAYVTASGMVLGVITLLNAVLPAAEAAIGKDLSVLDGDAPPITG